MRWRDRRRSRSAPQRAVVTIAGTAVLAMLLVGCAAPPDAGSARAVSADSGPTPQAGLSPDGAAPLRGRTTSPPRSGDATGPTGSVKSDRIDAPSGPAGPTRYGPVPKRSGTVARAPLPTWTPQPLTAPRVLVLPSASPRPVTPSRPDMLDSAVGAPGLPAAAPTSSPAPGGTATAEAEAVRLSNRARTNAGCPPLRVDAQLTRAAREHSRDMAEHGYFAHVRPGGRDPFQRMAEAGYRYGAAENIAAGQATADRVVQDWLASPDHRATLLDCSLDEVGIGLHIASRSPNVYYWTQDFGDRR